MLHRSFLLITGRRFSVAAVYLGLHLACLFGALQVRAEISTPAFFSDGMVLQREGDAKVWGKTDPGTELKATFGDVSLSTTSDEQGKWSFTFKNLKADTTGKTLTISSAKEKKVINDVLVGEVWLASGQSNMEWTVNKTSSKLEANTANDSLLRVYVSANIARGYPQTDLPGSWKATKPGNTGGFTSVGYNFARKLRAELDVPVGVIECAWGGKTIQSFISREALENLPEAKKMFGPQLKVLAGPDFVKAQANYQAAFESHADALKKWEQNKQGKKPEPPRQPNDPGRNPFYVCSIYNGMVAPFVGYGIRGALWYQGESNAKGGSSHFYAKLQETLIKDWRARWGKDFSFYYVQLAAYHAPKKQMWVTVQDQQRRVLDMVPGTGMAVITDVSSLKNIHPPNKKDVGERLARWALHHDYGKSDVIVSGPLYQSSKVDGSSLVLSFKHAKGLKASDEKPLQHFELSDKDGKWHSAKAEIKGDTIVLTSDQVTEPVHARYAWNAVPTGANLTNTTDLPASCFTTE
ncbi:sialate O-acetylesterase [Oceaniferula spumae]